MVQKSTPLRDDVIHVSSSNNNERSENNSYYLGVYVTKQKNWFFGMAIQRRIKGLGPFHYIMDFYQKQS